MKTSNAIFLSFLIFLFGGIILLFISAKYFTNNSNKDSIITQEKSLKSFSVVVAEPGAIFNLKTGKENEMSQRFRKESVPNFPSFLVRNDTLFVYALENKLSFEEKQFKRENFIIGPDIFCKNVKSIVAKEKAEVYMTEFEMDSLNINVNSARLYWDFGKVSSVSIQAKDSDINLRGNKLDKLLFQLDKTKQQVDVKERIDNLSGSLKNNSDCFFSMSKSIKLDADQTSRYNFFTPIR